MFTKKNNQDVKKSTVKIQDSKRDSATRLKHLKIVLEHYDVEESKAYFEANFSHVYFILYDNFIQAENNLRQKVHKAGKEELEGTLSLLEKVLCLMPELISKRWQMHSLTRIFSKLLHPGNSHKLRAEAIRYFLLWYQALGENAPGEVHKMFATLVPGLPEPEMKPTGSPVVPKPTGLTTSIPLQSPDYTDSNIMLHPNFTSFYENQNKKTVLVEQPISTGLIGRISASIFHDTNVLNPVQSVDILPLLPPTSSERAIDNEPKFFLEILLDGMANSVTKVYWKDRSHAKAVRSFAFLLDKFRTFYLPFICPQYDLKNSLYNPILDLPTEHNILEDEWVSCRVALIKWVTGHVHTPKKQTGDGQSSLTSSGAHQTPSLNASHTLQSEASASIGHASPSSLDSSGQYQHQSMDEALTAETHFYLEEISPAAVVREVLVCSTREHIDFTIEIMRQAFLLPFSQAATIRRVITVYKDWIQGNQCELPIFLTEPDSEPNAEPSRRLRSVSYIGAVNNFSLIRAGLQNVLQVFMTQAANVFVAVSGPIAPAAGSGLAQRQLLEEQTDTCKRVLNMYRYMVMYVKCDDNTWEQLLMVLLQITSLVLTKVSPKRKHESLGGSLAPAIFQTLIVTWIKANLNVAVRPQLWQSFMDVLGRLTHWEELLMEWAKTMETLTRVLARHVYGLDLAELSESRARRRVPPVAPPPQRNLGKQQKSCQESSKEPVHHSRRSLRRCRSDTHLPTMHDFSARHGSEERRSHNVSLDSTDRKPRHVSTSSNSEEQKMRDIPLGSGSRKREKFEGRMRKFRSLDSLRKTHVDGDKESYSGSRSPSPAPSSGIESNSMKDSPLQIDLANDERGHSDFATHASNGGRDEGVGVACGGSARGWVWDAAGVLWRRMLAALGTPSRLPPAAHAHHAALLLRTHYTLAKIAANQTLDGNIETHVPFNLFAGWCLEAEALPPAYKQGKLKALQLLCSSTQAIIPHNTPTCTALHPQHLQLYQRALHHGLTSEDRAVVDVIIKHAAPRYLSLCFDGYSLLLLDFVHASTVVLNSTDLGPNCPRTEAVTFLGSLLNLPDRLMLAPMLQPYAHKYTTVSCPDLKEHVVNIVVRVCRREASAKARAAGALALLAHVHRALCDTAQRPRLPAHVLCLLHMLTMKNKNIAKIVSDGLFVLADSCDRIMELYPGLAGKIVRWLCTVLAHECDKNNAKPLAGSLLLCLSEFCIRMGPNKLLEKTENNDQTLLLTVFKVLYAVMRGSNDVDMLKLNLDDDFDPEVQMDDLPHPETAVPSNIDVKLWAQMVCTRLVVSLGHWPLSRGHELSSCASELEVSPDFVNSPNMLFLRLHYSVFATIIDMPGQLQPGVADTGRHVRLITRELCGKSCWDLAPAAPPVAPAPAPPVPDPKHCSNEEAVLACSVPAPRSPGTFPHHTQCLPDHHQLDRLLEYISETSPEVACAWNSSNGVSTSGHEAELIASLAGHRNQMRTYLSHQNDLPRKPLADATNTIASNLSPNCGGRALLRQLGALAWQRRKAVQLLKADSRLRRELHNLDSQRCRETHKVAIIYVARGQETRQEILSNRCGSPAYEAFLAALAWEVELESHTGFSGGLGRGGGGGASAPYYSSATLELLLHVATRMPATTSDHILTKTRHLGNDEVHVVWSEHWREYKREVLPTQFCDVLIVLYPLPGGLLRVTITRKPDVCAFGPISDESILTVSSAAALVREAAVAGGRAVRAALPLYQHAYSERARALDAPHLLKRSTQEQFMKRLMCPDVTSELEQNYPRPTQQTAPEQPHAAPPTTTTSLWGAASSPRPIKRLGAFKRQTEAPSSPPLLPARRNR